MLSDLSTRHSLRKSLMCQTTYSYQESCRDRIKSFNWFGMCIPCLVTANRCFAVWSVYLHSSDDLRFSISDNRGGQSNGK